MQLLPVGVGDAFSSLRYSCCLALRLRDDPEAPWLLIDCPHPTRKMLREAGARAGIDLPLERLQGVVLTHLHADHASGLESFCYWFFFVMQRRLPLYAHPAVLARLWEGHLAAGMEQLLPAVGAEPRRMSLSDYFEIHPLDEARPVPCGPFQVECRPTIHHIPTFALRIRPAPGAADASDTPGTPGPCLGHSADTAFDPGLIAWLAEADLIVHESNLGVHTPYEDLAALPADLRARMRLIHLPDHFDRAASCIACLEEGAPVPIPWYRVAGTG